MAKTKITEFQDIDNEQKDLILGVLQNASTAPHGLVTNGGINITFEMLREISLKDIAYALNHKEEFGGLLDEVEYINFQSYYGIDYNSDTFKDFVLSFADNSSFKPKLIEISNRTNDNIVALSIKTGININYKHEEELQKKVLIKELCNQIKGKNVNSLTTDELDQLVIKACNEAKSTDGFPMKHTHALWILSKFDFSKINEDYSYIKELLANLYAKQEITSEYYHLQQEEGLHFYLDKVTDKNAEMWLKYANDARDTIKYYHGDNTGIKKGDIGFIGFIPSIGYYDRNDTWVAVVSNESLDLNNIDPKSIEMSVTMMTSRHAHFTSHVGISRGASYTGDLHKNISPKLHSFIAAATLQHYGDILDTVNKHYMITVPASTMREILIKAFKDAGQETNIFIGDNTTECSKKTLEVLSNNLLKAMKIAGPDKTDHMRYEIQKTQLDVNIIQQKESLEKTGMTVPIKITEGEGYKECLNWILQDKEGNVLHNLNPQDMEGEYAWFFKSPYLWNNRDISVSEPVVTCGIEALAAMGGFDTSSFEHECRVETIGDSYTLSE